MKKKSNHLHNRLSNSNLTANKTATLGLHYFHSFLEDFLDIRTLHLLVSKYHHHSVDVLHLWVIYQVMALVEEVTITEEVVAVAEAAMAVAAQAPKESHLSS